MSKRKPSRTESKSTVCFVSLSYCVFFQKHKIEMNSDQGYLIAVDKIAKIQNNSDGYLTLTNLNLTTLPHIPYNTNVITLNIQSNKLTDLASIPTTVVELNASNNLLTSLPPLPCPLKKLYVINNKLTSLPRLPEGIETIWAANNQLKQIPRLPKSIVRTGYNLPIDFDKNSLEEPFASFYREYKNSHNPNKLDVFKGKVNAYWDRREKYSQSLKNLGKLKLLRSKTSTGSLGENALFQLMSGQNIASYLSGIKKPINKENAGKPNNLALINTQRRQILSNAERNLKNSSKYGGKRSGKATRKSKKTYRKTRKNRKH